jgi:hypothetical protein
VTIFSDEHNHTLLEEKYCSLLPRHRKISAADNSQIESFRKVGIMTCQVFGAFANNSGGYYKIAFKRKDLYNKKRPYRISFVKSGCS